MTSPLRGKSLHDLAPAIRQGEPVAIAVSGGLDSMTLAHAAAQVLGSRPVLFHAVSPAVPTDASERVRRHAARFGWDVRYVDAGEMADPRYRSNPLNRCYFCKTHLYGYIRAAWAGTLFSGANVDDLGEYRPGLIAAAEHAVRHPYVEAGFLKRDVRSLAAALGLEDLAELPAQPCLSSRVETGISISPPVLSGIDQMEQWLRQLIGQVDVRCRVRATGISIEIDAQVLGALPRETTALIRAHAETEGERLGLAFYGIEPYRRGSAFVARRPGVGEVQAAETRMQAE
jgi:uncharacterized protein